MPRNRIGSRFGPPPESNQPEEQARYEVMASVAGKLAPNQLVFRLKEKGLTWCQIRDRLKNAAEPSSPATPRSSNRIAAE